MRGGSNSSRWIRTWSLRTAGLLTAATALAMTQVGVAAASNAPTIAFTATPTVGNTSAAWDLNRGSKQIIDLTCALVEGATTLSSDCGTLTQTKTDTSSVVSWTGLAAGDYTYTVTTDLTDGGSTTASMAFTVTPARLSITLTGTGDSISDGALDVVSFGSDPSLGTFTVTNVGGAATGPLTTSWGTTNPTWTLGSDACSGVRLASLASCEITLQFTPATVAQLVAGTAHHVSGFPTFS